MFCNKCGCQNINGEKYCNNCGVILENNIVGENSFNQNISNSTMSNVNNFDNNIINKKDKRKKYYFYCTRYCKLGISF